MSAPDIDLAVMPSATAKRTERLRARRSLQFCWIGTVVIIGVVAAAVNAIGFWTPTPWGDELSTQSAAERPLGELIGMITTRVDAVHALYYVLMHSVAAVGGTSIGVLRLPSVLAVGIAAAGVAVLGARFGGRRSGAIAAAIFTVIPQVSWAATEARSSALQMAAAVWLAILLLRALRSGGGWWIGHATLVALSVCLNVYLVLMVGSLLLAAALLGHRSGRMLISSVAGTALASPIVLLSVQQSGQVAWLTRFHLGTVRQVIERQWFGDSLPFTVLAWGALLLLLALVARRRVIGSELRLVVLSACCALLPTAILLAVTIAVRPVYAPRYAVMSLPFIALLAAVPLVRMRQPVLIAGVLVLVAAVTAPSFVAQRMTEAKGVPYAALESALEADADPGDAIWINADDLRDFRIYAQSTLQDHADIALAEDHRTNGRLLDSLHDDAAAAKRAQRFSDLTVVADRAGWRRSGWLRALREEGFEVTRLTAVPPLGVIDAVVVDLERAR